MKVILCAPTSFFAVGEVLHCTLLTKSNLKLWSAECARKLYDLGIFLSLSIIPMLTSVSI